MGIQIKKFRASTLQKAIEDVRYELGDDAIILQTDTIKEKGVMGKTLIEVTAAIDRQDEPAKAKSSNVQVPQPVRQEKRGWLSRFNLFQKTESPALPAIVAAKTQAKPEGEDTFERKPAPQNSPISQLYAMKTYVEPLEKEIDQLKSRIAQVTEPQKKETFLTKTPGGATRKKVFDPLEHEIQKLRTDFQMIMTEKRFYQMNLTPDLQKLTHYWASKGLTQAQITTFLAELERNGVDLEDSSVSNQAIVDFLNQSIQQEDVLQKTSPRIVVLLGGCGVGKTTTIAKLAAYEKIKLKRSVCLLSLDDFKIGGSDQLAHYGRILDVPFLRPRYDASLESQIKFQQADTIFIDTFGISTSDQERTERLHEILQFKDPEMAARLEVHLVVPVGISATDVSRYWEHFKVFNPQYLIFTKWDETFNWGGMLSTIMEAKRPVTFICNGQNVPDDMRLFSQNSFIETVTDSNSIS